MILTGLWECFSNEYKRRRILNIKETDVELACEIRNNVDV